MDDTETQNSSDSAQTAQTTTNDSPAVQSDTQSVSDKSADTGPKTTNGYEGKEFVEFTPEQQKRVNTLTKKLSSVERETQEYRNIAKQQYDLINELRQGQGQIVAHLQQTNFVEAESQIKAQRKEAYARGDIDAVDQLNDKLSDIKLQKKFQENQPKQQARPVQPQIPQQPVDVMESAVRRGEISRSDADVFEAWQNETDTNGNPLRPWTNERDQRNAAAAYEGRAVFSNPSLQNKPFAEKLKEIDRRMGLQQQSVGQGVMPSGNLTRGGKNSNVKLSEFAENIAVRTKFAGPKASRAEHIEAYRAQMADVRSTRR